jgi:hypothetical protein
MWNGRVSNLTLLVQDVCVSYKTIHHKVNYKEFSSEQNDKIFNVFCVDSKTTNLHKERNDTVFKLKATSYFDIMVCRTNDCPHP